MTVQLGFRQRWVGAYGFIGEVGDRPLVFNASARQRDGTTFVVHGEFDSELDPELACREVRGELSWVGSQGLELSLRSAQPLLQCRLRTPTQPYSRLFNLSRLVGQARLGPHRAQMELRFDYRRDLVAFLRSMWTYSQMGL